MTSILIGLATPCSGLSLVRSVLGGLGVSQKYSNRVQLIHSTLYRSLDVPFGEFRKLPSGWRTSHAGVIARQSIKELLSSITDKDVLIADQCMWRTLALWKEVFEELGDTINVNYLVITRNPFVGAKSLADRYGIDVFETYVSWVEAAVHIGKQIRSDNYSVVTFDEVVFDPSVLFSAVKDYFGFDESHLKKSYQLIQPSLRRSWITKSDLYQGVVGRVLGNLYDSFRVNSLADFNKLAKSLLSDAAGVDLLVDEVDAKLASNSNPGALLPLRLIEAGSFHLGKSEQSKALSLIVANKYIEYIDSLEEQGLLTEALNVFLCYLYSSPCEKAVFERIARLAKGELFFDHLVRWLKMKWNSAFYRSLGLSYCDFHAYDLARIVFSLGSVFHPENRNLAKELSDLDQKEIASFPLFERGDFENFSPDRLIESWGSDPNATEKSRKLRICFSGDTAFRSNWGCRSTTYFLRKLLESRGDIRFTLDTSQWKRYFEYRGISYSGQLAPTSIDDFLKVADYVKANPKLPICNALANADLVVVNGEGAFLDFVSAGRQHLLLAYLAKEVFRKPCVIINHTADFTDDRYLDLVNFSYRFIDEVVYREKISFNSSSRLCNDLGVSCRFGADVLYTATKIIQRELPAYVRESNYFGSYPDYSNGLDLSRPYICVGGSARWRFQSRPDHDSFGDYINLCHKLAKIGQVVIVAIEHQEEPYLRDVAKKLGLPFCGSNMPVFQAIDLLSHANLYVGGRWHTAIKALLGGGSVVLLDTNSRYKTEGLLDLYQLDQPKFDFFDVGSKCQEIVDFSEIRFRDSFSQRDRLRSISMDLADTVDNNFRFIDACVGSL